MRYLSVCIAAALAMSVTVYNETASILLAFAAYSATGTLVLLFVLLADALAHGDEL